jgi:hypothetical protein
MTTRLNPRSLILPAALGLAAGIVSGNFAIGVAVFAVLIMPTVVRLYVAYAADNPRHLWFKRKLYGWGWVPVTWEGWLVTVLYVGLLAAFALTIDANSPPREIALTFVLPAILLTIAFFRIAYRKGEKPRWQWGEGRARE